MKTNTDNNINSINQLLKIQQNQQQINKTGSQNNNINSSGKSFGDVLTDLKLKQFSVNAPAMQRPEVAVTFSKHARQRLAQRNIDINFELVEKINGAVKKASEKSIKNALVLSDESAFIVSVDNKVVVTAMNNQEMRESVITNIDGTVIL